MLRSSSFSVSRRARDEVDARKEPPWRKPWRRSLSTLHRIPIEGMSDHHARHPTRAISSGVIAAAHALACSVRACP